MITADQRAKITDFGLAKIFIGSDGPVGDGAAGSGMSGSRQYSATLHGEGCGSPPWMPPEQFYNARQSNVRNDVYSFGVMLFQMASGGYLPFAGKTYDDYYHQHETGSVPELESPFFPVILRCMEKNPAKRYGSFKAIRRELLRIAGKAGVPLRGGWFKWRKADAAEFFNWGESLQLLRRPGEAISYYDRALSQNPYNAIIWNSKGRCLGDLQRDREALSCFEWAIRINNQYADAWFNLAVAGESNRSVSLAVDAYRNYLRLDQESRDDAAFKRFAEERIKTLTEW
jgi:serine/threonine protein kinase